MDFSFNVNTLFPEEITVVRSDLIPEGYSGDLNHSLVQQQVGQYINRCYRYFAKGNFTSDNFTSGNFPNVHFSKRQFRKSVLVAALCHFTCSIIL